MPGPIDSRANTPQPNPEQIGTKPVSRRTFLRRTLGLAGAGVLAAAATAVEPLVRPFIHSKGGVLAAEMKPIAAAFVRQVEGGLPAPAEPEVPPVNPANEVKPNDEGESAHAIGESAKPREVQAETPRLTIEAGSGTERTGAGSEMQQAKERLLTERTKIDFDNPETWRTETPDGYGGEPFSIRITESSAPRQDVEAVRQNTYSIGEGRNLQPDVQHIGIFFQVGEGFPAGYKFSLIGDDPEASNGKGMISWLQPFSRTVAVGFEPFEQDPAEYRWWTQPVHPKFNYYILALFKSDGKLAYIERVKIGEGSVPPLKPVNKNLIERVGPELKNR